MPSPPILFITFDRLEITQRVFEQIRQAKPDRLYLVSDGAKPQQADQEEKVQTVRNFLSANVDWACSVEQLFRNRNWGCDRNIPNAIDWFFETEDEGIILEDDCLPDPAFFRFCAELLKYHKSNERVMMISGDRFLKKRKPEKYSYTFSTLSYSWGWATWRDRWNKIKAITEARGDVNSQLIPSFLKGTPRKFWNHQVDIVRLDKSTWDVDWQFALWAADGVSIMPPGNLVTNIGATGTHMKPYDPCINLPTVPLSFPLTHPAIIESSEKRDIRTEKLVRRSVLKNVELILKYAVLLPFQKDKTVSSGIKSLIRSMADEISHRQK
jgi:hypothetical protein